MWVTDDAEIILDIKACGILMSADTEQLLNINRSIWQSDPIVEIKHSYVFRY